MEEEMEKKIVENIRKLHREIDEMLEEKLRVIDGCMESSRECPCSEEGCEVSPEKFERLDYLYTQLFEDKKIEEHFEESKKVEVFKGIIPGKEGGYNWPKSPF